MREKESKAIENVPFRTKLLDAGHGRGRGGGGCGRGRAGLFVRRSRGRFLLVVSFSFQIIDVLGHVIERILLLNT